MKLDIMAISKGRPKHKSPSRLIVLIVFLVGTRMIQAQEKSHYAVVGAFAKEGNAKNLYKKVKSRFDQSTYVYNQNRNLYYVYALQNSDRVEVVNAVKSLQQETEFHDSWVFSPNGRKTIQNNIESSPESKISSVTQIPYTVVSHHEPSNSHTSFTDVSPDFVETDSLEAPTIEAVVIPIKLKRVVNGKLFKFDIRKPNGEPLAGKVHHVDLKKQLDIASYSSEDYSDIPTPENLEKPMTIVCGIFGYKEITRMIDYENPALTEGATQDAEDAWVIPFSLERLKLKDESIMYNVGFHENSVVLQPDSRGDLDELVTMMVSNPKYKIRIHGHANGKGRREIQLLGKSKKYFEMDGTKKKTGTGKELSRHRADLVRAYLTDHGIDHSRIAIKAHGGTHMIVHVEHNAAVRNDRIEIEITAE